MGKELEICVRGLVSFDEMKEDLFNLGFRIQEDFVLKDIYMVLEETFISLENEKQIFSDYLLIRHTLGKKKMITLKRKKFDKDGMIQSQESLKCQIYDISEAYNLLNALGYKKLFEICDHNLLLTNGQNEIYLQDVEGVGVYLEMEQKNLLLDHNNGDTILQMIDNLNKYDLKIDKSDYFVRKAYDVLKASIND